MKKVLFISQCVICSIFLGACSDKTLDLSCTSILLNSSDTVSSSFGDFFDITMCLPLEETENSHINTIRRVEFFEGNYYVSNSSGDIGLLVFNKEGKFVRKIGSKGNGRGEYTNIIDFSIDKKNRRILLLCNRSSLVKVYSLDGTFQKEKILHKTSLNDFACVNGLILCTTNHQGFTENENDSLFYIFDENLNYIKKHTYIPDNNIGTTSLIPSNIRAWGNKFVYSDFHEHRTFLLNDHGEIENCFKYEEDDLVSLKEQKSMKKFMEGQINYSFILSSSILNNKCITVYKVGQRIRLSINNSNGEHIANKPINSFPYFMGYDGDQALSAVSFDELKSLNITPNHKGIDKVCYYIIKYKLKDKIGKH